MSNVRRSLLVSLGANYLQMIIGFMAVIVISRLLSPADIGVFSIAMACAALGQAVRDMGAGNYLVQERELTPLRMRAAAALALVAGVALALLTAIAAPAVAAFYDEPALRPLLWILAFNFLLSPIGSPAQALLRRTLRFGPLAAAAIVGATVQAGLGIGLAFLGYSYFALAIAAVAAQVASLLMLMACRVPNLFMLPHFGEWRRVARFGGFSTFATLIGEVGAMAPELVLGRVFGFAPVAFFSRASGLVKIFQRGVLYGILPVSVPAFAQEHRRHGGDLPEYLRRAISLTTGLGWPFFGLLALLAEPVVVLLYGEPWRPAAALLAPLCLAAAISTAVSMANAALIAVGRADLWLVNEVVVHGSRLAFVIAGALHSMEGVGVALIAAACVNVGAAASLLRVAMGLPPLRLLTAGARSLVLTVAAVAPVALFLREAETADPTSQLFWLAVVLAGIGWLLAVIAVRHPLSQELIRASCSIRRRFGRQGAI